jgi:hypothetical protein
MRRRRQPTPKWRGELAKLIKWTGPSADGRSPLKMLLGIELTEEEKEEHQQALGKAFDEAAEQVA